jgi:hypothetical protein
MALPTRHFVGGDLSAPERADPAGVDRQKHPRSVFKDLHRAGLFPTFGAAIAGIRYFGDFDRFSAISEVTAEKLDAIHSRARLLADAPNARLHYGVVNALMHAADDVVVSEIENWQSVFGGKNINVPV